MAGFAGAGQVAGGVVGYLYPGKSGSGQHFPHFFSLRDGVISYRGNTAVNLIDGRPTGGMADGEFTPVLNYPVYLGQGSRLILKVGKAGVADYSIEKPVA